ncbi:MAG: hypothetical protein JW940_25765 [Polyangiaceae bacterium]|nr:hypothetical protein [Polyangiaceae bacterium]
MRDLLGKLALPLLGAVLSGSCSPSTGSTVLEFGGAGPTGGVGTGGYADYYPTTGGTFGAMGGYNTGGSMGTGVTGGWGGTSGTTTGTGAMTGGTTSTGMGGTTASAGRTGSSAGGSTGSPNTGGTTSSPNTGGTTSSSNTGGTSSSSTGGTATGTGGEESTDGPFTVKAGGYVTSGAMKGYAWTAGDDITPEDFSDLANGGELCASGIVPATAAYDGTGMIGINLNQATTGASKGSPYTPTGSGIKVAITNDGGSPLRLQVQGSQDYCTDITAPGGSFDWGDFETKCWGDEDNEAYDPSTSITAIMVLVPGEGAEGSDIDYDFCITNVEEIP